MPKKYMDRVLHWVINTMLFCKLTSLTLKKKVLVSYASFKCVNSFASSPFSHLFTITLTFISNVATITEEKWVFN